jgi:hypothetical protein
LVLFPRGLLGEVGPVDTCEIFLELSKPSNISLDNDRTDEALIRLLLSVKIPPFNSAGMADFEILLNEVWRSRREAKSGLLLAKSNEVCPENFLNNQSVPKIISLKMKKSSIDLKEATYLSPKLTL